MTCNNMLIARNPFRKVKRLREDNARTRFLTLEDEQMLSSAINKRHERLRPMIIIALQTAMRQGEIVNLRWRPVEWERNRINVINTKNAVDRSIPMNQAIKDLLIQLWRDSDKSNDRVFPNPEANAIGLSFRMLVKKPKLVDFRFHDLRHTFATRLAESGVDDFTIAALLGHKTLSMTASHTHPSDDHKREAIEELSNYEQKCFKNVTIAFEGKINRA